MAELHHALSIFPGPPFQDLTCQDPLEEAQNWAHPLSAPGCRDHLPRPETGPAETGLSR